MKLLTIFSIGITLSLGSDLIPNQNYSNWTSIQNSGFASLAPNEVWIGYDYFNEIPICRTISALPFHIDSVTSIIKDIDNYPQVFDRVLSSKRVDPDAVHIVVDMPYPFANRDYIVKYETIENNTNKIFKFKATDQHNIPLVQDCIRLPDMEGEWHLTPIENNKTLLSYSWNGELLGSFPGWALNRAWRQQANEIFEWLNDELSK